jgi:hypothetical protein
MEKRTARHAPVDSSVVVTTAQFSQFNDFGLSAYTHTKDVVDDATMSIAISKDEESRISG